MEDEEEECCVPALVDLPSKVIQISAGDSHTAALTEDGHVYIWGKYIYCIYIIYYVLINTQYTWSKWNIYLKLPFLV